MGVAAVGRGAPVGNDREGGTRTMKVSGRPPCPLSPNSSLPPLLTPGP